MELPDLGERLLETAEEVNRGLYEEDGDITTAQMKNVILDVSRIFNPDDNEMQKVWLTLFGTRDDAR